MLGAAVLARNHKFSFWLEIFIILLLNLQTQNQVSTTKQVDLNIHPWNPFPIC